jgi:hypothetical protein
MTSPSSISKPAAKKRSTLAETVSTKVAEIEHAPVDRLRKIWTEEFGKPPPPASRSPEFFRRLVGWKVQEKYLGGLEEWAREELDRLVKGLERDPTGRSMLAQLKPGMVLIREWKGEKHKVIVGNETFEHNGKQYESLSEVARHITGTRWSGPLFFGLKLQPKRRKAA